MKSVIIIPARYASTRFPGKPLERLGNKPVIQHVVERAQSVSPDVYVATDDARIYDRVIEFGGQAVMTSDAHRSGTDRCFEAYNKICTSSNLETPYDVVVNIQGDEPFIHPEQILQLIACFQDPQIEIATLAKGINKQEDIFDPNKVKVVFSAKQTALYFSRASIPYCRGISEDKWAEKNIFYKHIGMYAYRPHVLKEITSLSEGILESAESLEQLRWLENGYTIAVRTTPHESIGIDTPEDLKKANEVLGIGF